MSDEKNLQAGITAANAGDLARATAFFAEVVKENPNTEKGWFLLGSCLSDPEKSEYCFRRVLALNPNHTQAKIKLDQLKKTASASAPPFHTSHASQEDTPNTRSPAISPFITPDDASPKQILESDNELPSPTDDLPSPEEKKDEGEVIKGKQSNKAPSLGFRVERPYMGVR